MMSLGSIRVRVGVRARVEVRARVGARVRTRVRTRVRIRLRVRIRVEKQGFSLFCSATEMALRVPQKFNSVFSLAELGLGLGLGLGITGGRVWSGLRVRARVKEGWD